MTLNSLNGTECSTEIIKKINDIIAQKATISLSNLDSAGEQRFTTLAQGISDANDLITALTTVVGTKLSAEVSLQQNGYIKFSNEIILQWGTLTWTNKTQVTITLPTSFSGYYSSIAGDVGAGRIVFATGNHTKSTFILHSPSASSIYGAYWLAVGY